MKNRKVIVTAFLLIAVMIVGVGYAAVSDTLNFGGDATVSDSQAQHQFDLDVRITAVSEDNVTWVDYAADTTEINRADDLIVNIIDGAGDNVQDSVDFQVFNLADAGDTEVIWFKVENESAHAPTLTESDITEQGTGDHFTANYEIFSTDGVTKTTVLPAKSGSTNGAVLVKLTITLNSTPSDAYQADFSFSIRADVQ